MRFFFICLVCCLLALPAASALGLEGGTPASEANATADSEPGKAPVLLPEVVVTATAGPTPQTQVPVRVQVITSRQIRETNARTLDGVLERYVPYHLQKYPGSLTQAGIRGYRSNMGAGSDMSGHVLILIDGNRAGTGNVGVIPVDNIERIEIYRGPCSVIYGASAMGGVINLITKRGKGEAGGRVGVEYGSYDYMQAHASVSGGLDDDRFGYALAAVAESENSYSSPGQGRIDNTQYQDQAVGGTLAWRPNKDNNVFAGGSWFNAPDVGSPGSTDMPSPYDTTDNVFQYANAGYDGAAMNGLLGWHLGAIYSDQEYTFNESDLNRDSGSNTVSQGVRGHFAVDTWDFGRLMVGGEYVNAQENQRSSTPGNVWSPNTNNDLYGVFAEQKFTVDAWTLYVGARYDKFRLSMHKPSDYTGPVEESSQDKDHVSWRGGVVFDAYDWLSFRAAAGSAFVPPTAQQLAGSFGTYKGNPNLEPETSLNFEGGMDFWFDFLQAGLTYFWSQSRNTITTDAVSQPGFITYQNVRGITLGAFEGYLKGVFDYSINKDNMLLFEPYFEGTLYTNRFNDDAEAASQYQTHVPFYISEYNAVLGLRTTWNKLIALEFNGEIVGPQKVQHWNPSTFASETLNKDSFMVWGARVTGYPMDHLEVYVQADNIFDNGYEYVYGYPMPGATVTFGLEFVF